MAGRPTIYTLELGDAICELISKGHTLRQIEKMEGMPGKDTIIRWNISSNETYRAFQDQYARAHQGRAELWAEEILDISDDGSNDWYEMEVSEGIVIIKPDKEHMNRSRLRVDTRKWLLSKVLPKVYGDKITQEHVGSIGSYVTDKPLTAKEFEQQIAPRQEEEEE